MERADSRSLSWQRQSRKPLTEDLPRARWHFRTDEVTTVSPLRDCLASEVVKGGQWLNERKGVEGGPGTKHCGIA